MNQHRQAIKRPFRRLFVAVFTSLVLLVLFYILNSYYTIVHQNKKNVLNTLRGITRTASISIDHNEVAYVINTYQDKDDITDVHQDSTYQHLHEYLKKIALTNRLGSDIYILKYDSLNEYYCFVVSSAVKPYYLHEYKKYPPELFFKAKEGGQLDKYPTENGIWLSAFDPIKNDDGKVIGIIQADYDFKLVSRKINNELYRDLILFFMFFGATGILLFTYLRKTILDEERNKEHILEQAEEINTQNEIIKKTNLELESKNRIITDYNTNLHNKVKARTKALRKSNEELGTFLYRSSHDLQGPIATLKGLCHIALIDTPDLRREKYLQEIQQTVDKLEFTLKRLREVYNIKKHTLLPENVNIKNIIEQSLKEKSPLNNSYPFELAVNIPHDLSIITDSYCLQIASNEIIENAFCYMKGDAVPKKIEINATKIKDKVTIKFTSTSDPIPPGHEEKIFSMFHKASETAGNKNAGLGLFMTKTAIEKVGGCVYLNKQSTSLVSFGVDLPSLS